MTTRTPSRPVVRALAGSIVAMALAAEVFVLVRDEWSLTPASLGVVFATLGAIITIRVPGHRFGPLYLTVGAISAAFQVTNHLGTGELAKFGYLVSSWAWAVPAVLVVTLGLLLLPDGHLVSRRWRWSAWAAAICVAVAMVAMPFDPEAPSEHGAPFGVWPQALFDGALLIIVVSFLGAFGAGIAAVIVRFRRADDPAVRRQLQLVALAGIVALGLYLASDLLTSSGLVTHDLLLTGGVGLIPLAVTVGIVKHGMFDLGRLLSRGVTYLLVSAVLVGVYLSVVLVPTALLGNSDAPDVAVALATLLAAASFRPVRRRIQRAVDRRFHRSRYDAALELDRFGVRLRDEIDAATVVADLRTVVGRTVSPSTSDVVVVRSL